MREANALDRNCTVRYLIDPENDFFDHPSDHMLRTPQSIDALSSENLMSSLAWVYEASLWAVEVPVAGLQLMKQRRNRR